MSPAAFDGLGITMPEKARNSNRAGEFFSPRERVIFGSTGKQSINLVVPCFTSIKKRSNTIERYRESEV